MGEPVSVPVNKVGDVHVFMASNYFTGEVGTGLQKQIVELFKQGNKKFVLDFVNCKVVNSNGISSIMDLALKIFDDFNGKIALANLDPTKVQTFELVGVIPLVPVGGNVEEAIQLLV